MDEDFLDTHLCLSCQQKMVGLENYVRHKKIECPSLKRHLSQISSTCQSNLDIKSELSVTAAAGAGLGLDTSTANLSLSYSAFNGIDVVSPESDLDGDGCKMKQCSNQVADANAGTDVTSDDESAVDSFFESLQLRSRFGHVQPAVCKTDYYSRLFDPRNVNALEDANVFSHQNLVQEDTQEQATDVSSLGVSSSINGLRFCATGSDVFAHSDTEDLLSFSVDDMSTSQPSVDSSAVYDKVVSGKQAAADGFASNCRGPSASTASSLPGKWRPGERPVLRYQSHLSRGKWHSTTSGESEEEQDDNETSDSSQGVQASKCTSDSISHKSLIENDIGSRVSCGNCQSVQADVTVGSCYELKVNSPGRDIGFGDRSSSSVADFNSGSLSHADKSMSANFSCSVCKVNYNSKYSFARHLLTSLHKRRAKGYCQQDLTADTEGPLSAVNDSQIRTLMQKQKPFQCRLCHFYTDIKTELMKHLVSDVHIKTTKEISLRCVRCQFVGDSPEDISEHLNSVDHDNVLSASGKCVLRKQKRVKVNSSKRSERRVFLCEQCPATFRSESSLTVHRRRRHTLEKPFSCSICCKSFADNSSLTLHKKTVRHRRMAAESSD